MTTASLLKLSFLLSFMFSSLFCVTFSLLPPNYEHFQYSLLFPSPYSILCPLSGLTFFNYYLSSSPYLQQPTWYRQSYLNLNMIKIEVNIILILYPQKHFLPVSSFSGISILSATQTVYFRAIFNWPIFHSPYQISYQVLLILPLECFLHLSISIVTILFLTLIHFILLLLQVHLNSSRCMCFLTLTSVLNTTGISILLKLQFHHITFLLKKLQWLLIASRINPKICGLLCKTLNTPARCFTNYIPQDVSKWSTYSGLNKVTWFLHCKSS